MTVCVAWDTLSRFEAKWLKKQARIMHKFSTASLKSLVLTVLRDPQAGTPGLLSVPYSMLAGASVARLVRPALSALRDENLCIIRARGQSRLSPHFFICETGH